jgi:hypothetical protein
MNLITEVLKIVIVVSLTVSFNNKERAKRCHDNYTPRYWLIQGDTAVVDSIKNTAYREKRSHERFKKHRRKKQYE